MIRYDTLSLITGSENRSTEKKHEKSKTHKNHQRVPEAETQGSIQSARRTHKNNEKCISMQEG